MIRQYLSRFMTGRYGMDQLNLFLMVTYLVLYLVFFLTGLWVLDMIVRTFRTRMKDREHRYFKCPSCGQQMRVPRGKGRITVHCRSCGATFEEKS